MEHLLIQNNDLKMIDFDRRMFPSLEKLECGSHECKFISFSVIHDIIHNKINVELYRETNLLLPPHSVLKTLASYVEAPEIHTKTSEALFWLLNDSKKQFERFTLAGKKELMKEIGYSKLQTLLKMIVYHISPT